MWETDHVVATSSADSVCALIQDVAVAKEPCIGLFGDCAYNKEHLLFFAGRYEAEPCFPKLPELFGHGGGSTRPGQLSGNGC